MRLLEVTKKLRENIDTVAKRIDHAKGECVIVHPNTVIGLCNVIDKLVEQRNLFFDHTEAHEQSITHFDEDINKILDAVVYEKEEHPVEDGSKQ